MVLTAHTSDPYTLLANSLGITRDVAKHIKISEQFKSASLVRDRGTAFNLLRCYYVAEIFRRNWGAAKAAKWAWLTQDQPYDDRVAITVFKKFLPESRDMFEDHPLFRPLNIGHRLSSVKALINDANVTGQHMEEIELDLRPITYILEQEGHSIWE